jgi:hypothetical protein
LNPKHKSDGGSTDYYTIPEGTRDLDDLIANKNMSFRMGNIFKACYRLGQKEGTDREYDLRKIIFFAQRELEMVEVVKPAKVSTRPSGWKPMCICCRGMASSACVGCP